MTELSQLKQDLIGIGRWVDSHNWCPATSGNLSARIDQQRILITVSGNAKGALGEDDLMEVDSQGNPYNSDKKPSAETLLHALIYGHVPDARGVGKSVSTITKCRRPFRVLLPMSRK